VKKLVLISIILLASFLRLYKLGSTPPSLYWDEASLGYNAYSILKTARDEHAKFLPLTNFAAFGDYKPPGYIYAAVPSVAIFGLTEFAVRLPSAFFGISTVIICYLLVKKLFQNEAIAIIASLFLAISPWHLQFSRGAFEGNLGLFFSVLGVYLFVKFATEKPIYLILSVLSFLLAMYTFTGQRLFVPFILIILFFQFKKQIISNLKIITICSIAFLILFWPLFKFAAFTIEGKSRFDEVTIFKDLKPIDDSISFRQKDHFSWWANIIHNRRVFFAYEYLTHYFDAFNPSFLFARGDVNPRLSIQDIGELYYYDLPLILAGIYFLFSKKEKFRFLILGWLLISPLGPATARETPHALRMIHILPTFQILSAYGIYNLYRIIKIKRLLIGASTLFLIFSLSYYLHIYYQHWPQNYSGEWQYGYKQAVEIVKLQYDEVDQIIVTRNLGRPYIYFLFYMYYDPKNYFESSKIEKDRFFFIDVKKFGKFTFSDNPQDVQVSGKILYVTSYGQLPPEAQRINIVEDLAKKPVFEIGRLNK